MITKEKIIEILHSHSYNVEDQAGNHLIVVDDDSWDEIAEQVKNCSISNVSVRDFFAANALKAEIQSWNAEMSDEYRAKLLEDMIERHGETTVYEALAKNSFEMADAMLHAR